jgi:hypothetical protein
MRRTTALTFLALLGSTLILQACDTEKIELQKSPCVGIEGSPCGPKRLPSGNA